MQVPLGKWSAEQPRWLWLYATGMQAQPRTLSWLALDTQGPEPPDTWMLVQPQKWSFATGKQALARTLALPPGRTELLRRTSPTAGPELLRKTEQAGRLERL